MMISIIWLSLQLKCVEGTSISTHVQIDAHIRIHECMHACMHVAVAKEVWMCLI